MYNRKTPIFDIIVHIFVYFDEFYSISNNTPTEKILLSGNGGNCSFRCGSVRVVLFIKELPSITLVPNCKHLKRNTTQSSHKRQKSACSPKEQADLLLCFSFSERRLEYLYNILLGKRNKRTF